MAENKSTRVDFLTSQILNHSKGYTKALGQIENVEEASKLSAACRELDALLTPPEEWVSRVAGSFNNSVALCLVLDLKIPNILSERQVTSLDLLANTTGANKSLIKCVMTHCVHNLIFDECSPELYALNKSSACLLDKNFMSWIHYLVDDGAQIGCSLARYAAGNNYQILEHEHQTAFNLAFQTCEPFYQYSHSTDKDRGWRFDSAMERYLHRSAQTPVEDFFNFHQLQSDATIVDVGGGRGHHSIRLASQYPCMSFTVQDLEMKSPTSNASIDASVLQNISWQEHDFFKEQPVKGASLYLLSHILMDHPNSECHEIIGRLAEAMTPKESILLVDDFLDPGSGGTLSMKANSLNLHLLAKFGRPFRTIDEWKEVFANSFHTLSIVDTTVADNGRVIFRLKRTA